MKNGKLAKIKEILDVCEKIDELDLNFILGYATGIAIKGEGARKHR